jgi:hypothetical protein
MPNLAFSQTKIWQSVDNEPLTLEVRQIIPQKYRVFKLDIPTVKTFSCEVKTALTPTLDSINKKQKP